MEDRTEQDPKDTPVCALCTREAVTIDRSDSPMCAKHASIFVTRDHRDAHADRFRIIR